MQTENQISQILGGRKLTGHILKGPMDVDRLIREGIPFSAGEHIKEALHLTDKEFANTLGISKRTLSRLKKLSQKLSPVASDRLYRITRILVFAKNVLGGERQAMEWLRRPQIGLDGGIPLNLLTTDAGTREVEDLLGRIEYGVIS
ncbi:MAG: DUF2384 domain-containing protein [Deltaproteobacteria bacterium]|nr:DUF2384 domain-containing protein [Deltaproteobacteria bacterium]